MSGIKLKTWETKPHIYSVVKIVFKVAKNKKQKTSAVNVRNKVSDRNVHKERPNGSAILKH